MKRGARKAAAAAKITPAPVQEIRTEARIEICRSFSFKINSGHYDPAKQYESQDFFCSQKVHCLPEEMEDASQAAYAFCKRQVLVAANEAIAELRAQRDERSGPKRGNGGIGSARPPQDWNS